MSAFIISKKSMEYIVDGINRIPHRERTHLFYGSVIPKSNEMGRKFYATNLDAVTQRYPDESLEGLPGPIDKSDILDNYEFTPVHDGSLVKTYKKICSLIYQCSEGDVFKREDFKQIVRIKNKIADSIVTSLPEYLEEN